MSLCSHNNYELARVLPFIYLLLRYPFRRWDDVSVLFGACTVLLLSVFLESALCRVCVPERTHLRFHLYAFQDLHFLSPSDSPGNLTFDCPQFEN